MWYLIFKWWYGRFWRFRRSVVIRWVRLGSISGISFYGRIRESGIWRGYGCGCDGINGVGIRGDGRRWKIE